MEKINNLKDLLIEQVKELYNAEKQQIGALIDMVPRANSSDLVLAIENHVVTTEQQINRLEKIATLLTVSSFGEHSDSMEGLIREGFKLISRTADKEIMDAALITTIQYIKHFEIAGYGSACTYANELQFKDIADLLHYSLMEEKEFDAELTKMAKEKVNKKAKEPLIS
ncbi:MAG: DUF892 family protein [Bacteroidetes bacterium]|nr:DUF892 family protein [Bacteroidota bacterium]HET6243707.1 DUF892 family protein [Bacteroidia bacterium]